MRAASFTVTVVALLALAACAPSGIVEDEGAAAAADGDAPVAGDGSGSGRGLVAAEGKPEGVRPGAANGSSSSGASSSAAGAEGSGSSSSGAGTTSEGGSSSGVAGSSSSSSGEASSTAGAGGSSSSSSSGGATGASPSVRCPGAGAFCGSDGVQGGDGNTLYVCPGSGQSPSSSTACGSGCNVQPAGTPDFCNQAQAVCPGAGAYCGSDGVTGGAANTLYQCPGAGQAPSSAAACASGCNVQAAGTPDYCNNSCSQAAAEALAWESVVIEAGRAGNCNPGPPACYDDYCMQFVGDAYQQGAGVSIPRNGTAAGDIANFQNEGVWNDWVAGAVPPCGAIVVWPGTSCNQGDGHIVISNGDGTASTSGWTGYAGSTSVSLAWLSQEECASPAGWANPP